jgi:hypothetical protein
LRISKALKEPLLVGTKKTTKENDEEMARDRLKLTPPPLYKSLERIASETAFPTATLNLLLCRSEFNLTRLLLGLSNRSCLFNSRLMLFSCMTRLRLRYAWATLRLTTWNDRDEVVVTGREYETFS